MYILFCLFLFAAFHATAVAQGSQAKLIDYIDEYGVNHGKGIEIDGIIWAPVNLGYHKTNHRWGKLYQWGRKQGQGYCHPMYFEGSAYSDPVTVKTVPAPPPSMQAAQSKANADVFYTYSNKTDFSSFDWLAFDIYRWNKSETLEIIPNTSNEPSPKGWRVPTEEEILKLVQHTSGWTTNEQGILGIWVSGSVPTDQAGDAKIFLPAAGYRDRMGPAYNRGQNGCYWVSTHSGTMYGAKYFNFTPKYDAKRMTRLPQQYANYAYSIRCVQIK